MTCNANNECFCITTGMISIFIHGFLDSFTDYAAGIPCDTTRMLISKVHTYIHKDRVMRLSGTARRAPSQTVPHLTRRQPARAADFRGLGTGRMAHRCGHRPSRLSGPGNAGIRGYDSSASVHFKSKKHLGDGGDRRTTLRIEYGSSEGR